MYLLKVLFTLAVLFSLFLERPKNILGFEEKTYIVDIALVPPLVMEKDGSYTGFDIDLWNAIASELKLNFVYRKVEFRHIFNDLVEREADLALAGITINEERERIVDFSHHYFDSGLRILAPRKTQSSFRVLIKSISGSDILKLLGYLIIFVVIFGHVFWLVERRHKTVDERYLRGIFNSFYFVIVTMATVGYGDITPRRWLGKVVTVFMMFSGIALFSMIQAHLTSGLTLQKLAADISSARDLERKVVATLDGSTSVPILKELGAAVVPVAFFEEAYNKLLQGEVEAVVYDSPVILYYNKNEGADKTVVVGNLFEPQYYGIVFSQGSDLREEVNVALLKLQKNGVYESIHQKWFGNN